MHVQGVKYMYMYSVIGCVIVVMDTKIAKCGDLGIRVSCTYKSNRFAKSGENWLQ